MPKLTVRDFNEKDCVAQDAYFNGATDAFLTRMGVDPSKIRGVDPADPGRYRKILETPIRERTVHQFAVDLDNKILGAVTLKQILFGDSCEFHGHIYDADLRGLRYGTQVFVDVVDRAFQLYHLKKIVCEPSVGNAGPNKLLQSVGLEVIATYDTPAAGILLARTANRYEIERDWFYRELRSLFL